MHLGIIKITYNRTAQPRCYHNAFYGRQFHEPRRGGNSDFAMTIWRFWNESATVCFVISLSICYWLFKCGILRVVCVCERGRERESQRCVLCVCVCACMCERGRNGHTTAACVLQTHTSFITVSVTRLCSPLGLELIVKLTTLLTVFTIILKAKACDFGKGHYIFRRGLCSANHNALCQLANQSRLRLLEGGTL